MRRACKSLRTLHTSSSVRIYYHSVSCSNHCFTKHKFKSVDLSAAQWYRNPSTLADKEWIRTSSKFIFADLSHKLLHCSPCSVVSISTHPWTAVGTMQKPQGPQVESAARFEVWPHDGCDKIWDNGCNNDQRQLNWEHWSEVFEEQRSPNDMRQVGSLASTELDSGLYVVDYRSLQPLQTPTDRRTRLKLSHPFAARAQNSTRAALLTLQACHLLDATGNWRQLARMPVFLRLICIGQGRDVRTSHTGTLASKHWSPDSHEHYALSQAKSKFKFWSQQLKRNSMRRRRRGVTVVRITVPATNCCSSIIRKPCFVVVSRIT